MMVAMSTLVIEFCHISGWSSGIAKFDLIIGSQIGE